MRNTRWRLKSLGLVTAPRHKRDWPGLSVTMPEARVERRLLCDLANSCLTTVTLWADVPHSTAH